ncbi:hypothetical protein [Nocardioides sp. B-3]|uniref:hypothetical protein n=1 Tax=Nocardioides sp. B-3 TaxID=2895565 RepID=UPI00215384B8|nr:hypothetical protein [Nocardioides sp. B-3]UUZ60023.1 hypothetical protein LP418_03125 [Nocardioides sp. B-3]
MHDGGSSFPGAHDPDIHRLVVRDSDSRSPAGPGLDRGVAGHHASGLTAAAGRRARTHRGVHLL